MATPHCLRSPLSFTGHFGIVIKHMLKQQTPTDAKLTPTKPPGGTSYTIHYNQLLADETAVRGGNNGIFDAQQPFFIMVFMGKMSEVMHRSHHYDDIFQQLVINIAFFYSL